MQHLQAVAIHHLLHVPGPLGRQGVLLRTSAPSPALPSRCLRQALQSLAQPRPGEASAPNVPPPQGPAPRHVTEKASGKLGGNWPTSKGSSRGVGSHQLLLPCLRRLLYLLLTRPSLGSEPRSLAFFLSRLPAEHCCKSTPCDSFCWT